MLNFYSGHIINQQWPKNHQLGHDQSKCIEENESLKAKPQRELKVKEDIKKFIFKLFKRFCRLSFDFLVATARWILLKRLGCVGIRSNDILKKRFHIFTFGYSFVFCLLTWTLILFFKHILVFLRRRSFIFVSFRFQISVQCGCFELLHIFPTEWERREERKLNYTIKIYIFWYFHMYTAEFFDTWLINAFWWSFNWTLCVCDDEDGESVWEERKWIEVASSSYFI